MKKNLLLIVVYAIICTSNYLIASDKTLGSVEKPWSPFSIPQEGNTAFDNLYTGTFVDLTGFQSANGAGLAANNVAGYNFRVFAANSAVDAGIGIEPFTGQTALIYGYSQNGLTQIVAFEFTSNEPKIFDLQSVDITIDGVRGLGDTRNVRLIGYRNGNPLPGATVTVSVTLASAAANTLKPVNVSSNSNFIGVDKIRIEVLSTDEIYAIGFDNINAINFRDQTVLPLKLVALTAAPLDGGVSLNWTTTDEENTDYFAVERSQDGRNYADLGKVKALNQNGINKYSFRDETTGSTSALLHYRLRMFDRDGKYTVSKVVSLRPLTRQSVQVFPNPFVDEARIKIVGTKSQSITLTLFDEAGRVQLTKTAAVREGSNMLDLSLRFLAAGRYYLKVSGVSVDEAMVIVKK